MRVPQSDGSRRCSSDLPPFQTGSAAGGPAEAAVPQEAGTPADAVGPMPESGVPQDDVAVPPPIGGTEAPHSRCRLTRSRGEPNPGGEYP